MGQQESIGQIEVILLRKKGGSGKRKRGRGLLGGPEAEFERQGGVQTIDLYPGFCVPIGRDRNALNAGLPASVCPVYRRWFLIIDTGDVSRCHAVAMFDAGCGCYQLTDLGSTNGTFMCETLSRAKRGCIVVSGLGLPGQPSQTLHLLRGDRLEANQAANWYDGQYCFIGESALLRLSLFEMPQAQEARAQGQEEGKTGTLIIDAKGNPAS
jgi:hypothetical protein